MTYNLRHSYHKSQVTLLSVSKKQQAELRSDLGGAYAGLDFTEYARACLALRG